MKDVPRGIYPMLYAFFDPENRIRMEALRRQIDAAVANGAHGIAILGLGTEVQKLSAEERRRLVGECAAHLAGRLPLCVTVAGETPDEQLSFAHYARSTGADWIMLQPPPAAVEEPELIRFFGAVADGLDCSVGIQNAPEFLGYGLSDAGLVTLAAAHPNVRVVKAETSSVAVEGLVRGAGDALAAFNGRCGLELPDSLRAGAKGMIPGVETIDLQVAIHAAFENGDERAMETRYAALCPVISFIMQGIPHFIAYGKLIAALRLSLEPCATRQPALAVTAFGAACAQRFAEALGPLRYQESGKRDD